MSCPIIFSAQFPSSWASVIVSFVSHISTTKTFNIPCARIFFVIHLSTHNINLVTRIVSKFGKRVELVLFLISLKLFTAWIFW